MARLRLPGRRLVLPALVVLLVLATTGPARADEPSALERLSARDLAWLEERVPDWKDLPLERRERLAANVLRVRSLSPEERRVFHERIDALKHHREAHRGPPPGRGPRAVDPRAMARLARRGQLLRAVGAYLWAGVSEESRQAIQKALGARGRDSVAMAAYRRLWSHLAECKAAEGVVELHLPDDAPSGLVDRVAHWRREAEQGNQKARLHLAQLAVAQDLHEVVQRLEQAGPLGPDAVQRVGALLRSRYPEAFARVEAELEAVIADEDALKRYVRRERGPRHGRGQGVEAARRLLRALEEAGALLERHPSLEGPARRLKRALEGFVNAHGAHGRRGPENRRGPPGRRGPGPGPPPRNRVGGERGERGEDE